MHRIIGLLAVLSTAAWAQWDPTTSRGEGDGYRPVESAPQVSRDGLEPPDSFAPDEVWVEVATVKVRGEEQVLVIPGLTLDALDPQDVYTWRLDGSTYEMVLGEGGWTLFHDGGERIVRPQTKRSN